MSREPTRMAFVRVHNIFRKLPGKLPIETKYFEGGKRRRSLSSRRNRPCAPCLGSYENPWALEKHYEQGNMEFATSGNVEVARREMIRDASSALVRLADHSQLDERVALLCEELEKTYDKLHLLKPRMKSRPRRREKRDI
jgi:hypothetical protein